MIHFIRLTRPLNLIIIGLTMYGLGWYFEGTFGVLANRGIASVNFFLLVFSTVLIAAAGNIINAYFDVRADRINKPEKLIIGKFVKRRIAIVTHWGINFVAFAIAAYLSWKLETFWYVFIHLLSINILWYYSAYFKRKFLVGNIMIAGLTGMVPMLVGLYFHQIHQLVQPVLRESFGYPFQLFNEDRIIIWLSLGLAGFAFILNLAREIVKDIEDVDGDKVLRAKTVPIVIGSKKAKSVISIILFLSILAIGMLWLLLPKIDFYALIPIGISALLVFIACIQLLGADNQKHYKLIDSCIKLAMVAGLLSPVYWKILIIYA